MFGYNNRTEFYVKASGDRARKVADDYDRTLTVSDFPYDVEIVHEDGSLLVFAAAKLHLWLDPEVNRGADDKVWLLVFTEHHGVHTYPVCDLKRYAQYERRDPARLHLAVEKWREKNPAKAFPAYDLASVVVARYS